MSQNGEVTNICQKGSNECPAIGMRLETLDNKVKTGFARVEKRMLCYPIVDSHSFKPK